MASVRPWPKIDQEDQWLIELMEERFQKTSKSPEQLRARAMELYAEAEHAEPRRRDALLALADRYEATADARLSRRCPSALLLQASAECLLDFVLSPSHPCKVRLQTVELGAEQSKRLGGGVWIEYILLAPTGPEAAGLPQ